MFALFLRGDTVYGYKETTEDEAAGYTADYVLVETLPAAVTDGIRDRVPVTYDSDTGEVTAHYPPEPTPPDPKEAKMAELNAACNAAILAGFTSSALGVANTYDFDYEAQINLAGMLHAINDAMVTEPIAWKASGEPQDHTIAQFKTVFADGLTFKNSRIQKYWTLKAQVLAATTPEEIAAITW